MSEESQSVYVSVAHRYWNIQWSEARNHEVYGRNASLEGVGSNLKLTLTVESESAGEAGLEAALKMLKELCDHRCFFTDIPEFIQKPSTLEAITLYLGEKLFSWPLPKGMHAARLTVAENESISCTVDSRSVLRLTEKHLNLLCTVQSPLDPESGLVLPRGVIWQAVREIAPNFSEPATTDSAAWGRALFAALQIKVKALCELNIDLGSQQSLRITSHS